MRSGEGRAIWLGFKCNDDRVIQKTIDGAEVTKVTDSIVTVGVPLTAARAGDHKSGFRACAERCGGPDVEGVSSIVRVHGRCH